MRHFIQGANRVYVNENLTALRPKPFKKAIDRVESHESWRSWTLDGKKSSAINVSCDADFDQL